MANCFDSTDPDSCQGLGTKLKILMDAVSGVSGVSGDTVSGSVPNTCIEFDIGDWTLSGKFYQVEFLSSVHQKGDCPLAEVQKSTSGGNYAEVGVEKIWEPDGTLNLRVNSNPDCRFSGRVVFDD